MIRGALQQDDYYKGQAVEVRNTHYSRERWRPAKIHRRTNRGCEVIYQDGTDSRPQHIMLSDLRPIEPTQREHAPKVATPLLSLDDIDRINAEIAAKERARQEEAAKNPPPPPPPPPQTLVLLKRAEPNAIEMQRDNGASMDTGRKQRMTKVHNPTRLSLLLRNTRSAKQIAQKALADLLTMSQSRLSMIEAGDLAPTDKELADFGIALDLDPEQLRQLRDEPEPEPVKPGERRELEDLRVENPSLRSEIDRLRTENLRLTADNVKLAAKIERAAASASHSATDSQLREENAILRKAVVFYAGLERS